MHVLIVDTIAPEGIAYLAARGFQVDQVANTLPPAELHARLADYEAIVTRSSTSVTPEFLAHAHRLRILGRAGVGVDNIDVEACSRQGVVVVNAPYGNVVSAAEHTVGMLLELVRKIPFAKVFDGVPRIVRLRDLHVEFIPEGHILVLSYEDRPGMVGRIGSILGRHNVNIASMHVGRRTKRGNAIVVLLLDEDVAPEVMEEITKAMDADFARVIRLDR
ncbi:MAG TPA: ACT domain-containing protein [Candidatus Limnocylindrales bacterium]|nr:ACT domain-containing protein [Candidatus Limnocylindrales bacterium]